MPLYRRCQTLRAGDAPRIRGYRRGAALANLAAGEIDAALAELTEVAAEEGEAYPPNDRRRVRTLVGLARAEAAAGRTRQARATVARVDELLEGALAGAVAEEVLASLAELRPKLGH